jgi:hypothetical protein
MCIVVLTLCLAYFLSFVLISKLTPFTLVGGLVNLLKGHSENNHCLLDYCYKLVTNQVDMNFGYFAHIF